MKLSRTSSKGFTLVEIMIVVAIIGILIGIAVPGFIRARTESRRRTCQENLTKIDGAIQQWALEKNKIPTSTVAWTDLVTADQTTSYLKSKPHCPADGATTPADYTITTVQAAPVCPIADATHVLAN